MKLFILQLKRVKTNNPVLGYSLSDNTFYVTKCFDDIHAFSNIRYLRVFLELPQNISRDICKKKKLSSYGEIWNMIYFRRFVSVTKQYKNML
jgi:hypothetical protein